MISQNVQNLGFFEKINGLFRKKTIVSKSLKVANLLYNAYQITLFLENVFSILIVSFSAKNPKLFTVGKIRKYDREYFEKQRF